MLYKTKFIPEVHSTNSAVWPVPYACAHPYNLDTVNWRLKESALHSPLVSRRPLPTIWSHNAKKVTKIYWKQRSINVLLYCWRFLARCNFENSLHRY